MRRPRTASSYEAQNSGVRYLPRTRGAPGSRHAYQYSRPLLTTLCRPFTSRIAIALPLLELREFGVSVIHLLATALGRAARLLECERHGEALDALPGSFGVRDQGPNARPALPVLVLFGGAGHSHPPPSPPSPLAMRKDLQGARVGALPLQFPLSSLCGAASPRPADNSRCRQSTF